MPATRLNFSHRVVQTGGCLLAAAALGVFSRPTTAQAPAAASSHASAAYQNLPMQFEPNLGQAAASARFVAHGKGYSILLRPDAATFALQAPEEKPMRTARQLPHAAASQILQMDLLGADAKAAMSSEKPLGTYVNYLIGGDRSKWRTGVQTSAQTRVAGVYPGVDLVYYGTQRQLEYDFVVAPGAKPESIHFALRGAKPVLAANGDLVLQAGKTASSQDMSFRKPILYQDVNGTKQPVDGAFTVASNGEVGFRVGQYDHARTLVIDPIVSYASYFGGSGDDGINGAVLNKNNQLYAVGSAKSIDLLGTAGEYQPNNLATANNNNFHQAFITKFSADGTSILWTTYFGGNANETFGNAIAVNAADQPYITGVTSATTNAFPISSNAVQTLGCPAGANAQGALGYPPYTQEVSSGCGGEGYVSQLSADGKSLIYSTFLGGASNYQDGENAIALDAQNNIYVAGFANSTGWGYAVSANLGDYPSWPINQHGVPSFGGSSYPTTPNAFMTAYAVAEALAKAAGPDPNGNLSNLGNPQAVVSEISADGTRLIYSSAIGGPNTGGCGNGNCTTYATSVAAGPNGLIYVGGFTSSAQFPTTANSFSPTCTPQSSSASATCNPTGWVAAFDTTKSGAASLAFSTYMVGSTGGMDYNGNAFPPVSYVNAVRTDAAGNVIITGSTNANNYPTTAGSFQPTCIKHGDGNGDSNVCANGFLTKLSPTGSTVWSTYIHGTLAGNGILGQGLALDASGNIFVLASASDQSLPLTNTLGNGGNGTDALVLEFDPLATKLLSGTYLGSAAGVAVANNSLSLDSNDTAYFGGSQGYNTYGGTYLPITPNAPGPTIRGNSDGFVVKLITQMQPSATALAVTPSGTVTPSTSVTLTATVTTSSTITGTILPTGKVTFLNGSTTLGTGTLSAKGVATYSGVLPGGTYSITAQYAGDTGFNGSTSSPTSLNVSSATVTATTLAVSPASVAYGGSATLTATVLAGNTPATSGTVSFSAGSLALGTGTVNAQGVATLTVKPAVGAYTVIASYAGTYDAVANPTGFSASVSAGMPLTVTKAASTTTLAASATTLGTGASLTLTATVTSGATGTVTFYNNGTTALGTATVGTGGTATLTTSFSTAASYSITASYPGDTNYSGSVSGATTVTVVTPSFTVTASPTSLTIARGSTGSTTLTFAATGGYSGTFTLSCGTLPALATCAFNPTTVTLAGTTVTDVLTIGTGTVTTSALSAPQRPGSTRSGMSTAMAFLLPGALMGLLGFSRRRKLVANAGRITLLVAVYAICVAAMTGCGGGGGTTTNYSNATATGTYTVPVSVTPAGGTAQAISLTLTVQ